MKWIRVKDYIYNANEIECFTFDESVMHVIAKTFSNPIYKDLNKEMFEDFIYWMNRCEDEIFDVNKCIELIRAREEHRKKFLEREALEKKEKPKCICEVCNGKREVDTED